MNEILFLFGIGISMYIGFKLGDFISLKITQYIVKITTEV